MDIIPILENSFNSKLILVKLFFYLLFYLFLVDIILHKTNYLFY